MTEFPGPEHRETRATHRDAGRKACSTSSPFSTAERRPFVPRWKSLRLTLQQLTRAQQSCASYLAERVRQEFGVGKGVSLELEANRSIGHAGVGVGQWWLSVEGPRAVGLSSTL